jgi:hypothetical protein
VHVAPQLMPVNVAPSTRDAADEVDVRPLIESESAFSKHHQIMKALSAQITVPIGKMQC